MFLTLIIILLISGSVLAASNSMEEIFIDVEILEDGTGVITQTWKTDINEGTELFIPMDELNHMEIRDFSVSDMNGPYTSQKNWNSNKSFKDKANQYGILDTQNGVELVFGVSEYGENTYDINYSFVNMVQSFSDKDGFNVRLVNDSMNPAPSRISYRIYIDGVELGPENADIWAFGYSGNIEFLEGEIRGQSTSPFSGNNYVNVLVSLDKGIINPVYEGDGTFADLQKVAFEGSTYDYEVEEGVVPKVDMAKESSINPIIPIIGILLIIGSTIALITSLSSRISTKVENYCDVNGQMPINEIPFDGKIVPTYYFSTLDPDYDEENSGMRLFFSFLMKWFVGGNITENYEFIKAPENFVTDNEDIELELWNFLLEGSITSEEGLFGEGFKIYMKEKYLEFHEILQKAKKQGYEYALENGFIEIRDEFPLKKTRYLTNRGISEMLKLKGTENHLKSMTEPIDDRKPDLLIMSALLGTNPDLNMEEEFKKEDHRPGYLPQPYPYYLFLHNTQRIGHTASTGIQSGASSSTISGSSGFGGGSSFGGGGGFSGGSGGGVR